MGYNKISGGMYYLTSFLYPLHMGYTNTMLRYGIYISHES